MRAPDSIVRAGPAGAIRPAGVFVCAVWIVCAGCSAREAAVPPGPGAAPAIGENRAPGAPAPAEGGSTAGSPPELEAGFVADFSRDVLPILETGCRPCHFEGGTMYAKLPFDRAATIRVLGEDLFTRIRDERERAVIRNFLAQ